MTAPQTTEHRVPVRPTIHSEACVEDNSEHVSNTQTCPQMYIVALFPIAESRNNPNTRQLMMSKQKVVHSYNGLLIGHKEEQSISIHRDTMVRVGEGIVSK